VRSLPPSRVPLATPCPPIASPPTPARLSVYSLAYPCPLRRRCSLEARAKALGVAWKLPLKDVNFTGCPAWTPHEDAAVAGVLRLGGGAAAARGDVGAAADEEAAAPLDMLSLPRWAEVRNRLAAGDATAASALAPLLSAGTQAARAAAPPDVILRGIRPGLPQLGLVLIQGAEVEAAAYTPFLQALQAAVGDYDVIVGVPSFDLSTPDPLTIGAHVDRVVREMATEAGLDNKTAKIAFAAHSLGGVFLQVGMSISCGTQPSWMQRTC
jgi:hypothetical protein